MCAEDHMQIELKHIATMISQLELLHATCLDRAAIDVMTPVYWRNRIKALLRDDNLPTSMTAQAAALLDRLEKLDRLLTDRA